MQASHKFTYGLLTLLALVIMTSISLAADPGIPYPLTSEGSDQKAGSVLFYNFYASDAINPKSEDTAISITNTNDSESVTVHILFVDSSACSLGANMALSLTPNQTTSFLVSDFDPGVTGYIVAVAVKPSSGCPVSFNYLIGSEYLKLASGHSASLDAEAFAALYTGALPSFNVDLGTATLDFDGIVYNRAPRALAFDNIRSVVEGNSALLILNRVGGDLQGGATLGTLFGLLFDDAENIFSTTFNGGCQFRAELSNNFPRVVNSFLGVIPRGHTGWMKIYSLNDYGILGAVINLNKKADKGLGAFNGGRNLHKLTLTTDSLTIPLIGPQ